MRERLNQQIGPLKLWQWLLVALLGIGLGILIRRRLGSDRPPAVAAVGNPEFGQSTAGPDGLSPTQGSLPLQGQQQDFAFQKVVYEFIDRFDDELDAIGKGQDDIFAEVRKRQQVVNQPAPKPQPAPAASAPATTATKSYWQQLVELGAIKGNPSYYDTGQATQAEFEHALRVADTTLRRDTGQRMGFWQRLVDRGHIKGDPTYYSQGRASQAEFDHAYNVAAASIASKGGAF